MGDQYRLPVQTVKRLQIVLHFGVIFFWVMSGIALSKGENKNWIKARARMIEHILEDVTATRSWIDREALDPRVVDAIAAIPRHRFVPERLKGNAYENRPLPIGHGQTISQPYIVALMTDLVEPKPDHRVLEVGTGSGYQAAVLSRLVRTVYTIEIIPDLGKSAGIRFRQLGYENVESRVGDGYYGWPDAAPFDGIVVTAVAGQIPPPLVSQLRPGGRMVIPIGHRFGTQYLMLVEKQEDGEITTRQLLPVRFVPLTGDH